jgi:predicted nuclease of predicted toxin-antitoxin system
LRILADENIPGDAVELLRARGHDVVWVRTDSPGVADETHLSRAISERRLLITFDKDFGQLIFQRGQAGFCGVVLFRIATPSSKVTAEKIADVLDSRTDWAGQFSVVDDRRIRMTPLPGQSPRQPR